MQPSLFLFIILIVFFLRLIIACRLWVIYVKEDNYSNVCYYSKYDYTAYMDHMDPDVLCPQKGR